MSRKKTYVGSVSQRLLSDADFKNSGQIGINRYLQEQKSQMKPNLMSTSIGESLLDAVRGSMPVKMRQMTKYANKKDSYIFGVPKSSLATSAKTDILTTLGNHLRGVEGKAIDILAYKQSTLNLYHDSWMKLVTMLGYSGLNNELTILSSVKGTPCYLYDGYLTLSLDTEEDLIAEDNIDQMGLAMSYGECLDRVEDINRVQQPYVISETDTLVITYAYVEIEQVTIPADPEVEGSVETIVDVGVTKYDNQVISINTSNPDLPEGEIMPNDYEYIQAVYKVDNEYKWFKYAHLSGEIPALDGAIDFADDVGEFFPRLYLRQHAVDLIDRPKTDEGRKDTERLFRKLGMSLKETTKAINEGIGDVTDEMKFTFLNMAISINKDMDDNITGEYLYWYFNRLHNKGEPYKETAPPDENTPIVKGEQRNGVLQRIADNIYTQQLEYDLSIKTVTTGVARNNANKPLEKDEYTVKLNYAYRNAHDIIHQVTDNSYVTITVVELTLRHLFYGQAVVVDGDDENLIIPLDYAVAYSFKSVKRELLLNKALQLTVTTLKVVKKKWYQTGIFKFVMAAISIAMNIIIPGSGLTLAAILEAVVVTVVTGILVNAAIGLLIDIAVSLGLSSEVILALAVVATIALMKTAGGGTFSKEMMQAKFLMRAINFNLDIYQKALQQSILKVRKEMQTFQKYAEDRQKRLEEAQAMLTTGFIKPELELLTAPISGLNDIYLGESPQEFYTRTTNIDVTSMTVNIVQTFLEVTTALPRKVSTLYERNLDDNVEDILLIT